MYSGREARSGLTPQREKWLVVLCLLLAAGSRALYFSAPAMDSDQAMVGLMAQHMLRGDFTAFWWTTFYGGTFESFLTAPIFWLLGISRQTLILAPVLLSLAFLLGLYCTAREIGGRRLALVALFLAALGPFHLTWSSVLARGIYMTMLACGSWLLWLTLALLRDRFSPSRRTWAMVAWGLLAGLAFWTHPLAVCYLGPAGLLLWRRDPRLPLRGRFWLLCLAFGLGSLPFWVYQLNHDWATFRFMASPQQKETLAATLHNLGYWVLPVVLGVKGYFTQEWLVMVLAPVSLGVEVIAVVWSLGHGGRNLWRRLVHGDQGDGSELLFLVTLTLCGLCLAARWPMVGLIRYLLPLYLVLPILLAQAFWAAQAWESTRVPARAGLLALGLLFVLGVVRMSPLMNQPVVEQYTWETREARALCQTMQAHHTPNAYVMTFGESFRLTFDSGERCRFPLAYVAGQRWPYLTDTLRAPQAPGLYLDPNYMEIMADNLPAMGATFRQFNVGFCLATNLNPPPTRPVALAGQDFRAVSPDRSCLAAAAVDGNAGTFWTPGKSQEPGQFLLLDLGKKREQVCQLLVFCGDFSALPQTVELWGDPGNGTWELLGTQHALPAAWVWEAGRLVPQPLAPWLEFRFSPQPLSRLKLVQTATSQRPWRVVELVVGVGGGESEDPRQAAAWLAQEIPGRTAVWCPPGLDAWLPPRLQFQLPWQNGGNPWHGVLDHRLLVDAAEVRHLVVPAGLTAPALRALGRAGWRAATQTRFGYTLLTAQRNPEPPGTLVAEDLRPRQEGEALVWDLGGERRCSRASLTNPDLFAWSPEAYSLEYQVGDGPWQPLAFRVSTSSGLYWAGMLPLAGPDRTVRLDFRPVTAARLRLRGEFPCRRLPAGLVMDLWLRD
ncbi:MAG: discoidin domain-containing protein [Deltaproteobacteria bacterium]|nr:discoidin domain-containing protein [Deltaproteobacteria bacterium]